MTKTGSLKDRVVIVTGGGRGIGREVAFACAAEGAAVVIADLGTDVAGAGRNLEPGEAVAAEIRANGGRALAHCTDVTSEADARTLVAAAVDAFGRLDGVVNNAGNMVLRGFDEMTAEDFDRVIKVHLYGSFNIARAAAEMFVTRGAGSYVHMTSSAALIGNPGCAGYCAAKGGVTALSRAIALDLADKGIRSNCVAPSAVSRMSQEVTRLRASGAMSIRPTNDVPAEQRQGGPAQVAPLVAYLLGDGARAINGQIFGVRGNEIYLYSQSRPVRTLHRADGWTVDRLGAQLEPAWRSTMTPLENLQDVFSWPPL
jgi:NAD(P)-dependent dehydrogenase (short-subunit alcohol dehydrogenase family)